MLVCNFLKTWFPCTEVGCRCGASLVVTSTSTDAEQLDLARHHPSMRATLGVIAETRAWSHDGGLYVSASFGRIVDELAKRFERLVLTLPVACSPPERAGDYRLRADNVEIVPQPFYGSSLAAMGKPGGILRAYWNVCRRADFIFVRGMLPFSGLFYLIARISGRRPCHWIVGDPIGLLRSHRRAGRLKDMASLAYAYLDRICTRVGNRLAGGSFICNGAELGEVYRSPRTHVTVSTTITEDDFFFREDTCQGPVVRILFVGFIRPEKGVEYLLEAVAKLKTRRAWELVLVGSYELHPSYGQKLEALARESGIADRVRWVGHVPGGPALYEYMRSADMLVLPTLSEGTPRVLVEARANSLPIIATRVGGIPTSVSDGVDGILVPSKDSGALAEAIDRVIQDEALRRALIRNGLETVRRFTVDRFVDLVSSCLAPT